MGVGIHGRTDGRPTVAISLFAGQEPWGKLSACRYSVTFPVSSVGRHAGGRGDDGEEVEPNLATGGGTGRGGGAVTAGVQQEMLEVHASLPGEWNPSETRGCSVVGPAFGGGRCSLEVEERHRAQPLVLGCRRARGRCDSYPFDRWLPLLFSVGKASME